jgi:hypothetical protein
MLNRVALSIAKPFAPAAVLLKFGGLMNSIQRFTAAGVVLLLAVSGRAHAKQDTDPGQEQNRGPEASEIHSSRQPRDENNVRGRERAEERRGLREARERRGAAPSKIDRNPQPQANQEMHDPTRAAERQEPKTAKAPAEAKAKPPTKSRRKTSRQ